MKKRPNLKIISKREHPEQPGVTMSWGPGMPDPPPRPKCPVCGNEIDPSKEWTARSVFGIMSCAHDAKVPGKKAPPIGG
jgi:hypothetical protein